jgi:Holliday junction DNA helicase RuvA
MFNHIEGKISDIVPTHVVVDSQGVGYLLNISLNTYSRLKEQDSQQYKLLVHLVVREDALILYGFIDEAERVLFRYLISVSGVGPNTARMILSSQQTSDICQAIIQKNVELLQSIKGIGVKTAQRIIVELQDKLGKEQIADDFFQPAHNTNKQEALSALIVLGFSKMQVEKILDKIISSDPNMSAEDMIRNALKVL